jgi:hypothetical protein
MDHELSLGIEEVLKSADEPEEVPNDADVRMIEDGGIGIGVDAHDQF